MLDAAFDDRRTLLRRTWARARRPRFPPKTTALRRPGQSGRGDDRRRPVRRQRCGGSHGGRARAPRPPLALSSPSRRPAAYRPAPGRDRRLERSPSSCARCAARVTELEGALSDAPGQRPATSRAASGTWRSRSPHGTLSSRRPAPRRRQERQQGAGLRAPGRESNKKDKEILRLKTELNEKDQEIVELQDKSTALEQQALRVLGRDGPPRRADQDAAPPRPTSSPRSGRASTSSSLSAKEEARDARPPSSPPLQAELDAARQRLIGARRELESLRDRAGRARVELQQARDEARRAPRRGRTSSASQLERRTPELDDAATSSRRRRSTSTRRRTSSPRQATAFAEEAERAAQAHHRARGDGRARTRSGSPEALRAHQDGREACARRPEKALRIAPAAAGRGAARSTST